MDKLNDIDLEEEVTLPVKSLAFLFACVALKSVGENDMEVYTYAKENWKQYVKAVHSMAIDHNDWLEDFVADLN